MGSFTLPNVTFTATLLPYVHNEKFRVKISERDLQIGKFEYRLHMQEGSQFAETMDQVSTVFAEHVRSQVNVDLAERFAFALQKGSH